VERGITANLAGVTAITVMRWQKRFAKGSDIYDAQRGGRKPVYNMSELNRFIAFYCQTTPLEGYGHWSFRWAENELRLHPEKTGGCPSRSTMQRILKRHDRFVCFS
jgi:transposase